MNILFLTTVLPGGRRGGGEIVSQQPIEAFIQQGHRVTVLGYQPRETKYQPKAHEISIGTRYIETDTAKYYPLWWMLSSYLSGLPYSAAKYYSKAYLTKATELLTRSNYDVVIIDHAQLGWLRQLPIAPNTKRIFISHNIEHELYLEQMHNTTHPIFKRIYRREARLIKRMEDRLAASADRIWTLTDRDAAYFASVTAPDRVTVLNIPTATGGFTADPDRLAPVAKPSCDLAMLGTWTWQPNQEGLQWFFNCVYPHLPPTISIRVAGKGADWLQDRYPNVEYCGFVPDSQVFISDAKAIAIPVTAGAGVQIKTLEAIAAGAAIVATPTALRGISDYPSTVRVSATPIEFAKYAIELSSRPDDRHKQQQEATAWSQQRWENFYRDLGAEIDCDQMHKIEE
jgi:polysaccharide biosynthesis protein PslH